MVQLRGEDRTSVTDLQNLLRQTAEVYRSLVQHAKAASVPVPPEAQLGTGVKRGPDELEYDEFAAANATDWDDFQDEGALLSCEACEMNPECCDLHCKVSCIGLVTPSCRVCVLKLSGRKADNQHTPLQCTLLS